VEPGSAEDVSKIVRHVPLVLRVFLISLMTCHHQLNILGSTRTPFAVKGGGHATNPGFSSTPGVQMSMTRFKNIKVTTGAATVEVGAGLTWDQVYAALEPYGVNVVGGRVPGIGVAGLTLGGGVCHCLTA
jgi:FAD/FMN-containing dehydrogenase